MKQVRKAVAAVVRNGPESPELLVFDHPSAGTQLVKGTVEAEESLEEGLIRELAEESGLVATTEGEMIGMWERVVGAGPNGDGPVERHLWHVFIVAAPPTTTDSWLHQAVGSAAEEGLVFEFRWVAIDHDLPTKLHALFGPVAEMIVDRAAAKGGFDASTESIERLRSLDVSEAYFSHDRTVYRPPGSPR